MEASRCETASQAGETGIVLETDYHRGGGTDEELACVEYPQQSTRVCSLFICRYFWLYSLYRTIRKNRKAGASSSGASCHPRGDGHYRETRFSGPAHAVSRRPRASPLCWRRTNSGTVRCRCRDWTTISYGGADQEMPSPGCSASSGDWYRSWSDARFPAWCAQIP